ncbi:NmrA-like family domain-containing protein 1 [Homo sapiens] [Rhizoctonia solani]|uniref:NmrA-like family domain-containing protein 1 [Homo sapiens] n=1 Tax=Rhizoctonia solani TaxID=456999 RepID=A0A0K6FN59_9AGAM|nr:NmrA-like family domain-containing protein 1 [Homo sapiens] [Rhizoctonia solani]
MPTDTSKPLIVVCGATGAQGSSVVEYLLRDGGYRVRALTRNPDGASAKQLRNRGVDVVMCDIGILEQVVLAFTGAYAVYGVTNFWEHGEAAEIQQGKNLADAAKACGVRHFIWPSLPHVPVIEPRHWESKITVGKYLNDIGVPTTALLTPFFFENLWRVLPIKTLPDGTFRLDWFWPSETLVPSFAAEDIGAWVSILDDISLRTVINIRLPGSRRAKKSQDMDCICVQKPTPLDYAATLTKVLGVHVVPRQVSVAEFDAVRPYVPDDLWLNMKAFLDHPELWKDAIEPCRKLHLEAQTLEQYIANHREQILGAAEPMAQAVLVNRKHYKACIFHDESTNIMKGGLCR